MSSDLTATKSVGGILNEMREGERDKLASKIVGGRVKYDCQRKDLSKGNLLDTIKVHG